MGELLMNKNLRLAAYLAYSLSNEGTISSEQIAKYAHVHSTQVRRDLSSLGQLGRAGVGYQQETLIKALRDELGDTYELVAEAMSTISLMKRIIGAIDPDGSTHEAILSEA